MVIAEPHEQGNPSVRCRSLPVVPCRTTGRCYAPVTHSACMRRRCRRATRLQL